MKDGIDAGLNDGDDLLVHQRCERIAQAGLVEVGVMDEERITRHDRD